MMVVDKIMDYEEGNMTADEQVDFFGELIASGMAWKLQGHYGRTATALIDNHFVDVGGNVLRYPSEMEE